MIKEFALDPVVPAQSSKDARYFLEALRIENGRVLARFPKAWKRMVYEAAEGFDHGEMELKRIVECLAGITDRSLFACGRPTGDMDTPWLDRAIAEHLRSPFSGIITTNVLAGNPFVLAADEADRSPIFRSTGQKEIVRTSEEIVGCVELLLKHAKTVKLVDPYFFKGGGKRWQRGFRKLIHILPHNALIEIHRDDDALPGNLCSWIDEPIRRMLTNGIMVRVFLHPKAKMHNRFILTEQGGAFYGAGLDDHEDGDDQVTSDDDVILLTEEKRMAKWKKYESAEQPFLELHAWG